MFTECCCWWNDIRVDGRVLDGWVVGRGSRVEICGRNRQAPSLHRWGIDALHDSMSHTMETAEKGAVYGLRRAKVICWGWLLPCITTVFRPTSSVLLALGIALLRANCA